MLVSLRTPESVVFSISPLALGLQGLGVRGLGFRGLGVRGLGFRGLGFRPA